jgi:hypothetical protein
MNVTQEDDRVPGTQILMVLGALTVILLLGALAAFLIAEWRSAQLAHVHGDGIHIEPQAALATIPGQVPEEINQVEQVLFDERAPGLEDRAFEQKLLGTYGWVDREARVVRIPIGRAIELYLEQSRAPRPGTEVTP